MSTVLRGVGRIYGKGQFDKDHQRKLNDEKTNSSLVEHSAPSIDIKPMAVVHSKLMPHCGAISIVLT